MSWFSYKEENENTNELVEEMAEENFKRELVIVNVKDYDNSTKEIKPFLKTKNIIIVKFNEELQTTVQQRYIDFLYGATTMMESVIYKITDQIIAILPKGVSVNELKEKE